MKPPNLDWNIMCPVCELPDPARNPYCFCKEPSVPSKQSLRDQFNRVRQAYEGMNAAMNNAVVLPKIRAFETALLYRQPFLFMAS